MFQDTQPAPLGAFGDGMDEFRVGSRAEIVTLLRRLLDAGADLFVSAPNGAHLRTTLWTVDTTRGKLSLAADPSEPQLARLVDAGEALVVGYLDHVKLQFDLAAPLLVHGAGGATLHAELPQEMFRFQRRQSYRVRTPPRSAAVAMLRHPSLPEMSLALRVIDVSIGGCALFVPDDVPPLAPGVRLHGVRIELDASTRFAVTLTLQHVTSLDADSGGVRLGCSFDGLDGDAQRALQRYIDHTQKRRRLLSLE